MSEVKYIVIEGIDGSGKSTQFNMLLETLGSRAAGVREPGGTEMAEHVRNLILDRKIERSQRTNLYLFSAARAELIDLKIRPAVTEGKIVVSDRNWLSTIAYQAGGEGVSLKEIMAVTKQATAEFFTPDFTIFIDVDPKISVERIKKSEKHGGEDYFDSQALSFFAKARAAYLKHIKELPNYAIIDGSQSVEKVASDIRQALKPYLN